MLPGTFNVVGGVIREGDACCRSGIDANSILNVADP